MCAFGAGGLVGGLLGGATTGVEVGVGWDRMGSDGIGWDGMVMHMEEI